MSSTHNFLEGNSRDLWNKFGEIFVPIHSMNLQWKFGHVQYIMNSHATVQNSCIHYRRGVCDSASFNYSPSNTLLDLMWLSTQQLKYMYLYSGTPPCRHPWIVAIYGNADTLLGLECHIHRLTYKQIPWKIHTLLFRKADTSLGPNGITAITNSPFIADSLAQTL